MNRLRVKVSVLEAGGTILPREDGELSMLLSENLKHEGLNILTGSKAVKFSKADGLISVAFEDEKKQRDEILADSLLVAVGRKANVEGLKLENAGVKYTQKGIITDKKLRTDAPNIYACGDVVGPYQFSHMAEYQGRIAALNAFFPIKRNVNYDQAAWCTFTDPELAHSGLTEEEARKTYGDKIKIYKHEYKNTDRGKTDRSLTGMGKFILN
jgi:pyruvate/2-oxoglutarate dehydrogenase complex dihydrolipoamide dehydrogenase (E3) component